MIALEQFVYYLNPPPTHVQKARLAQTNLNSRDLLNLVNLHNYGQNLTVKFKAQRYPSYFLYTLLTFATKLSYIR